MVTAHGNGLSIPNSRKFKYGPTSLNGSIAGINKLIVWIYFNLVNY